MAHDGNGAAEGARAGGARAGDARAGDARAGDAAGAEGAARAAAYRAALAGRFAGILTWPDLDALWTRLQAAPEGWYLHDPTAPPPDRPAAATAFLQALDRASEMLSHARSRDWCGAVYVDDPAAPALVKIFDPFGMAACGGGSAPTRPWLILSRLPPAPLDEPAPAPARRRGLLARLTGGRGRRG